MLTEKPREPVPRTGPKRVSLKVKAPAGHAGGHTCKEIAQKGKGECQRQQHGHHGDREHSRARHRPNGGRGCPKRAKAKGKVEKVKEKAKEKAWDSDQCWEQSSKIGNKTTGEAQTGQASV